MIRYYMMMMKMIRRALARCCAMAEDKMMLLDDGAAAMILRARYHIARLCRASAQRVAPLLRASLRDVTLRALDERRYDA